MAGHAAPGASSGFLIMRPILSECFEGNAGRKKSYKRCTQMKLVQEAHAVTTKTRQEMKGCIIDYLYHHAPVACNNQQRPWHQIQPRDRMLHFHTKATETPDGPVAERASGWPGRSEFACGMVTATVSGGQAREGEGQSWWKQA